jgi:CrcB protein
MIWLAVAAGSAVGGLLRFGLSTWLTGRILPFPWPILLINVAGSFLIGWWLKSPLPPAWRAFLVPGLCGGFTTFSTFSADTLAVWELSPVRAVAYVFASVGLSLGAAWLGMTVRRP